MFINESRLESYYTAQIENLSIGNKRDIYVQDSMILFCTEGSFLLTSGDEEEICLCKEQMVFLHSDFSCTVTALEKGQLLELRFPEIVSLCNTYLPDVFENKKYTAESVFSPLPTKKYINLWINSLQILVSDLKDPYILIKTKTEELFLLLKICYPKEDLLCFLAPLFSSNYEFTLFVLNNYYKVKTVSELAQLSSLSLSGFEREFRKVFNTSPYRWMLKKKMKKLFYEISATDKLFKIIAEEYGFLSLSQLGDFCRKHFGASPREIRNKKSIVR